MQHCDDDALALVALGEEPSAADATHLRTCPQCRAEVESFGRVVAAGSTPSTATVVPPPARVWEGIAAATGVTVRPRGLGESLNGTRPDTAHRPDPGHRHDPGHRPGSSGGPGASGGEGGPSGSSLPGPSTPLGGAPVPPPVVPAPSPGVVPLRPRDGRGASRRGRWPLIAVAASALVVGTVLGSVGTRILGDEQPAPVQVVAQAKLDPLPVDPAAKGEAVIVQTGGVRTLKVDTSKLARTDGFYEVWLIDASVKKMIPIGILDGSTGTFTIPPGVDLGQYPVVDISAEPLDGNPTHSGKSLLRGVIPG